MVTDARAIPTPGGVDRLAAARVPPIPSGARARVAAIKRAVERWMADPRFRQAFAEQPAAALRERQLTAVPEALVELVSELERPRAPVSDERAPTHPDARRYRAYLDTLRRHREAIRALGEPDDRRMRRWRARQIERCTSELGPVAGRGIVHAPIAFELSNGCSVGCRFCAVSAPGLADIFSYTPANARLWRTVLAAVHTRFGDAGAAGFCYWATEPLDNPDYERFCADFATEFGRPPPTTTALAARALDRARALARQGLREGVVHRFSVLSLGMLDRLHAAFTPEELLGVELTPLNRGSILRYSNAGRARARYANESEGPPRDVPGTIACVTGFLVNMVDRRVRLISPTQATEDWPLGYRVYAERHFDDGPGFAAALAELIERAMPLALPAHGPLRFRPDLRWTERADGFDLANEHVVHRVRLPDLAAALGQAIVGEALSPVAAAERLGGSRVADMAKVHALLTCMFDRGLFDDAPASPPGVPQRPQFSLPVL